MSDKELGGVWRTVMGRRIFIKDGQSLQDAMRESGKFGKETIVKKDAKERLKRQFGKDKKLTKRGERDIIETDEYFPKSVGAKVANYDIKLPSGDVAHIKEGTYISNKEIFAGKGAKTEIRDVEVLVKRYGGNANDWKKIKGQAILEYKTPGKLNERKAEIHWYEEPTIGKVKVKWKKWI